MAETKAENLSEYNMHSTEKKGAQSLDVSASPSNEYSSSLSKTEPLYRRIIDSFKPYDLEQDGIDTSKMTELEKINYTTSKQLLSRKLKGRHLQMIAFGSSIGTGLFVGSGNALSHGGPAGQLIAYLLVGFSLLCVIHAVGEMSVQFPISGSFNVFFSRFVDPSWGFTLGLVYSFSFVISFPLELIACSITIGYWESSISPSVWVAIFYVVICSIHFFNVKTFGETEFVLSGLKVMAVVGFIILGICLICGAGKSGFIGAKYWHNPGAFNHGFKGLCSSFLSAAFTFGGIEVSALASAETVNPRKSIPRATKQVFWRIALFYILTSVVIGCLVPYNNPHLLSGSSSEDITASPFVIAVNSGGIRVLPDIMNAVILISVLSVGVTSIFAASRTLSSLAAQGFLPKCIGYVDRMGRPLGAIMVSFASGLLGFLAVDSKHQSEVFTWFFATCSLGVFCIWISICFTHLRFRWALKCQGRSLDEVLYVSPTGVWGSVCGMVILTLIVIAQIWTSIWPLGVHGASGMTFLENCLALPVMLVLWAGYKTCTRSWGQLIVNAKDVDLDSGRRELDIEVIKHEVAEEKAYIKSKPIWYRVYRQWC